MADTRSYRVLIGFDSIFRFFKVVGHISRADKAAMGLIGLDRV